MMLEFLQNFINSIRQTSWLEYTAVISGIASVWYSRKENILVYPVGLVSTLIYVYLSFQYHLIGESAVNFYYTLVSIYGWYVWSARDKKQQPVLHLSFSTSREWIIQLAAFVSLYIVLFLSLTYLKQAFYPGAIPWADAFASATAFIGMWLMARKKVESWWWWLATDLASIPLYSVKHLALTSVYYFILFVMAIFGLLEWRKRAKLQQVK